MAVAQQLSFSLANFVTPLPTREDYALSHQSRCGMAPKQETRQTMHPANQEKPGEEGLDGMYKPLQPYTHEPLHTRPIVVI